MKRRRLEALFEDQMMEMGTLEDDEALKEALSDSEAVPSRLSEHVCEDVQEAHTADAFDFMLNYTEPTMAPPDQWELVATPGEVPVGWTWTWVTYRDMDTGIKVHIYASGRIQIASLLLPASILDRMQSLKALGKMHFGEDWGEE